MAAKILDVLKGVKEAFETKVIPQQEPTYDPLAAMDPETQRVAIELFYKADKFADLKETFLAVVNSATKLIALHLLLAWVSSLT